MTYHRITDEDRWDLMSWLESIGFDGKPGPANWLRAMVSDWAEANVPRRFDDEGIPYSYDDLEHMAYDAMILDDKASALFAADPSSDWEASWLHLAPYKRDAWIREAMRLDEMT